MTCWPYIVLHLVLLVKIKNIIPNKRPNGRYSKNLKLQNCYAVENNQLECGDYSLLFSIRADDDEQHFLLEHALLYKLKSNLFKQPPL